MGCQQIPSHRRATLIKFTLQLGTNSTLWKMFLLTVLWQFLISISTYPLPSTLNSVLLRFSTIVPLFQLSKLKKSPVEHYKINASRPNPQWGRLPYWKFRTAKEEPCPPLLTLLGKMSRLPALEAPLLFFTRPTCFDQPAGSSIKFSTITSGLTIFHYMNLLAAHLAATTWHFFLLSCSLNGYVTTSSPSTCSLARFILAPQSRSQLRKVFGWLQAPLHQKMLIAVRQPINHQIFE